eukprot:TRINITY_DN1215_c0_g2_i1.p1 TRINITY_DN1215_c0_g2~~TRINITY_DN1215_c0_g2_i1.p1  ORF type:complete len:497 (+),score=75.59 TRINITY_DN1215_c0_g2_i1:188-1492(+)
MEMTAKYGKTWVNVVPFTVMVVSSEPKNVSYILQENFKNYVKGPFIHDPLEELLGEGIFTVDGERWKKQRKTASHLFKVKELKLMADVFVEHGNELVQILKNNQDQLVDLQDLFSRLTLDSIGQIAFGTPIGSLHKPVAFSHAFNTAQLESEDRFINFWWKATRGFNTKMKQAMKTIDEFAYSIIAQTRKEVEANPVPDPNDTKINLLKSYMYMKDDNGEPFSDRYLRDIILNFLLAGRDTTAQTLSWMFYLLSQHPTAWQKLRTEVLNQLQDQTPDYDNIKDLSYLDSVINETLRLYPPVPWDTKTAVNDDVLPSGHQVKAGFTVSYVPWILGRLSEYWDSPEEFKPERWQSEENNGGKAAPKHKPPFIPFNYGKRTCLGQGMAYEEVKIVACLIIQSGLSFVLKKDYVVRYKPAVTILVAGGLWMTPVRVKN